MTNGRLGLRPPSGGLEFQNRHTFDRPIVRAAVRIDHRHAGILNPEFFFEHRDLVERALKIPG